MFTRVRSGVIKIAGTGSYLRNNSWKSLAKKRGENSPLFCLNSVTRYSHYDLSFIFRLNCPVMTSFGAATPITIL
jgi:hypothetical protein